MKLGTANVSFRHLRDTGRTLCTVVVKGKVYHGTATCSKEDSFCRNVGRKISMANALKATELSKIQRRNVWNAYRTMTKEPRWS
jgi:hypothetical protein